MTEKCELCGEDCEDYKYSNGIYCRNCWLNKTGEDILLDDGAEQADEMQRQMEHKVEQIILDQYEGRD